MPGGVVARHRSNWRNSSRISTPRVVIGIPKPATLPLAGLGAGLAMGLRRGRFVPASTRFVPVSPDSSPPVPDSSLFRPDALTSTSVVP